VPASSSYKIRGYDVGDTAVVYFIFYSGALGTLSVSDTIVSPWSYGFTAGAYPAYPITYHSAYYLGGTKSSIQFPNYKEWYNKSERSWWRPIFHKDESPRESRYTLTNQIIPLCDVVNKKANPKITGEDGLVSLKIFAAIIKSAKTGQKVKIK
jgi:Predicted dehydrogenases and related proteins